MLWKGDLSKIPASQGLRRIGTNLRAPRGTSSPTADRHSLHVNIGSAGGSTREPSAESMTGTAVDPASLRSAPTLDRPQGQIYAIAGEHPQSHYAPLVVTNDQHPGQPQMFGVQSEIPAAIYTQLPAQVAVPPEHGHEIAAEQPQSHYAPLVGPNDPHPGQIYAIAGEHPQSHYAPLVVTNDQHPVRPESDASDVD
ncbi:hypothetical protein AURDEDRAFT_160783 [Auricularia subglabra TFB-10046 SS5]|nr:hypothetical protein AURDEDRAFT_160783 [Auricularia subglabra TFB-10046 SS5]